ncbi:MAG: PD-(D/E)XK nuclease family transposase [Treponema sp.]
MSDELQITLTNDFAFKFFLGSEENKPILQDLLQCILALSPQEVSDIELMDKELAKEELSDKTGILDVKLKLTNGTVIDNEKIDIVTLSPVERKLYESRMKLKSDITTIAETQFTAGLAEGEERGKSLGLAEGKSIGLAEGEARGKSLGLAEGIGQGFAEGMRKTARLMKQYNYPLSDISSITGLSKAEIEAL